MPGPPTSPTPTIDRTAEAVSALLVLCRALSPTVHTDTIRPALHTLAVTVARALDGGATLRDLLDAVIRATAPAPPDPPPPWTPSGNTARHVQQARHVPQPAPSHKQTRKDHPAIAHCINDRR